jgi:hypothetical protein
MASAISTTSSISDEERRWAVVGVCINKVLTPQLRHILATEIQNWYNLLCRPPDEIHKQVFSRHKKKLPPSTFPLKYENINNNNVHKYPKAYDFKVKDPLSLAKLFVQPFMAKFTAFDQTMDMSAVLAIMCEADPFVTSGAAVEAKTVRSNIRNKWAHCNFSDWTKPAFMDAFRDMHSLVKKLNLSPADEKTLCDNLDSWRDKGIR